MAAWLKTTDMQFPVRKVEKSKIKVSADSMSVKSPLPVHSHLFSVSPNARRSKGSLWGPFYKGTHSKGSTSIYHHRRG